jgi:hypothetical protein
MFRKHQCDICDGIRSDITVAEQDTSQGKMRACATCAKSVCAGVECVWVVTATERAGINIRDASRDHTKAWCSNCRVKCDVCEKRCPTGKAATTTCDAMGKMQEVCAHCRDAHPCSEFCEMRKKDEYNPKKWVRGEKLRQCESARQQGSCHSVAKIQ